MCKYMPMLNMIGSLFFVRKVFIGCFPDDNISDVISSNKFMKSVGVGDDGR